MKRYNELNKCSKCGGSAKTKFVGINTLRNVLDGDTSISELKEILDFIGKLERKCLRCGYIWYEEPTDVKGDIIPSVFGNDSKTSKELASDEKNPMVDIKGIINKES